MQTHKSSNRRQSLSQLHQRIEPWAVNKFEAYVQISGKKIWGTGETKEAAKYEAAKEALNYVTRLSESTSTFENKQTDIAEVCKNDVYKNRNQVKSILTNDFGETSTPIETFSSKAYIVFGGQQFWGYGNSESKAKCEAAKEVLKYVTSHSEKGSTSELYFSGDHDNKDLNLDLMCRFNKLAFNERNNATESESKYEVGFDQLSGLRSIPKNVYQAYVVIGEKKFWGFGTSESSAKVAAAQEALKYVSSFSRTYLREGGWLDSLINISGLTTNASEVSSNNLIQGALRNNEKFDSKVSQIVQKQPLFEAYGVINGNKLLGREKMECVTGFFGTNSTTGLKRPDRNSYKPDFLHTVTDNRIGMNETINFKEAYIPEDEPVFRAYVEIGGKQIWSYGDSVNSAKCNAAQEALKYVTQISGQNVEAQSSNSVHFNYVHQGISNDIKSDSQLSTNDVTREVFRCLPTVENKSNNFGGMEGKLINPLYYFYLSGCNKVFSA